MKADQPPPRAARVDPISADHSAPIPDPDACRSSITGWGAAVVAGALGTVSVVAVGSTVRMDTSGTFALTGKPAGSATVAIEIGGIDVDGGDDTTDRAIGRTGRELDAGGIDARGATTVVVGVAAAGVAGTGIGRGSLDRGRGRRLGAPEVGSGIGSGTVPIGALVGGTDASGTGGSVDDDGGSVLSGGNVLAGGAVLSGGIVLSGGSVLSGGTVLSGGIVLSGGNVLAGGNVLPGGSSPGRATWKVSDTGTTIGRQLPSRMRLADGSIVNM